LADNKPVVIKEGDGWVVRVDLGNGKAQTYRCSTEQQAKTLVAALMAAEQEPPRK